MTDHPSTSTSIPRSAPTSTASSPASSPTLGLDEAALRAALATPDRRAARRAALARGPRRPRGAPPEPLDDLTRRRLLAAAATVTGPQASQACPSIRRPVRGQAHGTAGRPRLAAADRRCRAHRWRGLPAPTGRRPTARRRVHVDGRGRRARRSRRATSGHLGTLDGGSVDRAPRRARGFGRSVCPRAPSRIAPSEAADSQADPDRAAPTRSGRESPATADQVRHVPCSTTRTRPRSASRPPGPTQGRPAVIVGIATGDRTIVFVVAADDCASVLYSASTAG